MKRYCVALRWLAAGLLAAVVALPALSQAAPAPVADVAAGEAAAVTGGASVTCTERWISGSVNCGTAPDGCPMGGNCPGNTAIVVETDAGPRNVPKGILRVNCSLCGGGCSNNGKAFPFYTQTCVNP